LKFLNCRSTGKIAPQANSGILYMVTEEFSASYLSGPEYQLIDDCGYPQKLENWQKTRRKLCNGSAFTGCNKTRREWNHTVIIVNKGHVQHCSMGKKWWNMNMDDTWKQHKSHR